MSEHSQGPWSVEDCRDLNGAWWIDSPTADGGRTSLAEVRPGDDDDSKTEANARRIVACVNAMDGIDDPAAIRSQRDALLEACKAVLLFHSCKPWHEIESEWKRIVGADEAMTKTLCDFVRTAIAKCDGEDR